ncbi:GSCOCG00011710001-RA-CDS, partial [Cotesia congregata]
MGMNTQDAILKFYDDIRLIRWLDVLVFKLKAMGFSYTVSDWILSYLKSKLQAVRNSSGKTTVWKNVLCGMPQGSVLGPLLYSIYVTDLGLLLKRCMHHFYADDLVIYLNCRLCDIATWVNTLNEEIAIVSEWCVKNGLNMNRGKMKAMIFGTVFKLADLQHVPVPNTIINNTVIGYCKSVKYLGVVLEDTLTWSLQVNEICKSTMRILAQL